MINQGGQALMTEIVTESQDMLGLGLKPWFSLKPSDLDPLGIQAVY